MIPFNYAILDINGEIVRKYRWSIREVKWFKQNNPYTTIIKLEKQMIKKDLFKLVGECLY